MYVWDHSLRSSLLLLYKTVICVCMLIFICTVCIMYSVAPIIGSTIGYRPIIGIVMHIGISGAYPYRFFSFFFYFVVFSKHLVCSQTSSQHHPW